MALFGGGKPRDELIVRCPFCEAATTAHCYYTAPAVFRATCNWRKCVRKECRAYGPCRDSSRWVRLAA